MDQRTIILILLVICMLLSCLTLSIITPFFPPFAISKGISEDVVGFIFSANPFGAITGSLILGKILNEKNRIRFMIWALFFQGVGLYLLVFTYYFDKDWQIIIIALIGRLINGFATAFFMTPLYAYIPIIFEDDVESKLAIFEATASIGFLIGPVVGSLFYSFGGYIAPFITFGTLSIVLVPIIGLSFKILKLDNNQKRLTQVSISDPNDNVQGTISTPQDRNTTEEKQKEEEEPKLEYSKVLSIYPILITTLAGFAGNVGFQFSAPVVANFYETQFDVKPENMGYYLVLPAITYTIFSLIFGQIKKFRRPLILFGILTIGISSFFSGPTKMITGMNHSIYTTSISFAFLGMGSSPPILYSVPELNNLLLAYFPLSPNICTVMSSALFNMMLDLAELLGPLAGGFLTKWYSFETACMYLGFYYLIFALFYAPIIFMRFSPQQTADKQERNQSLAVTFAK